MALKHFFKHLYSGGFVLKGVEFLLLHSRLYLNSFKSIEYYITCSVTVSHFAVLCPTQNMFGPIQIFSILLYELTHEYSGIFEKCIRNGKDRNEPKTQVFYNSRNWSRPNASRFTLYAFNRITLTD